MKRKKTRTVNVGGAAIGSDAPVSIQSMTKTDTSDIEDTIEQINSLEKAGCDIVRLAIKYDKDVRALQDIKKSVNIPLVADIHFDHKLAVAAIKNGADKIRVNPGNISNEKDLDEIIFSAGKKGIPIRIGVNSGSVSRDAVIAEDMSDIMVEKAMRHIEYFKKKGFEDLVVSLKASDVVSTVNAYRKMSEKVDFPLHLGVTASGLPKDGIIRSSVGIGTLLMEGIGDTIRVSITGDPLLEVDTGRQILESVGLRKGGLKVIACPTCGRCQVDLIKIASEVEEKIKPIGGQGSRVKGQESDKPLVIAVMGCEVNGPGEAVSADIGIAFGKDKGMIFADGEKMMVVSSEEAVDELVKIVSEKIKM